jgi:thioesterase domain-containing protein/acyl carrier protein
VLDQDGRPLGSEETGELVVRSRYTALGEWQGGRLVAGRLRPDPADPLRRTLRTGDLVRVRTDGVVVVVSRKDRQIQIHGMRIEPYEIECALRSSPSVINAAVVPCETEGETSLTAFVVLAEPCDMDAIRELKKHLARSMPSHMRPSRIIPLERLPLLPGYKVDIEALRALGMSPERPSLPFGQDWSPVDGMGKTLEQAWCRIFGRDSWERDATFADVGGDSLDLLSLVFAVERQLDIALPLANFDLDMTDGDMARVVTAVLDEDVIAPSRHEGSSVVLLKCGTGQPPVFITPGLSGHGGEVREIGKFLASDRPVFALQAPGLNGGAVLTEIEAFAAQYTATIEKIQPRGPYVLIGNSLGGFIALEVARILRGRGERVALTALLESYPHPRFWPISPWLDVLLGLARHHLYTIRGLPPGQIVPYTAIRAANLINHLAARLLRVLQPFDVGAGSARLRKVRRGLIAAWARYRPSRYDGDIVFFKPQTTVRGLPREPLSVWWKFVGQMEVITVPGDHDTMRGAHADSLAAALDRCIERALAKG